MKRNHLPTNPNELAEEQEIINQRLRELLTQPVSKLRQIPVTNKGIWLEEFNHVKVESTKGISSDLLCHSSELNYQYLDRFEALFCLEANQLIIYSSGFPLSLAEAYQLLITDSDSLKNYRVFQHLNRSGYICLAPDNHHQTHTEPVEQSGESESTAKLEIGRACGSPLFEIDSIDIPLKEVFKSLREFGPQSDKLRKQNQNEGIAFNVYKRETFASKRPRKDKPGEADFGLIICDKLGGNKPNWAQIRSGSGRNIIYALVDDNSICFSQFEAINPNDLALF